MGTDVVTSAFRAWGSANGFQRKGTTLYRDQPETLAVVNLQGSQWGGRYYVNVALWLKQVAEPHQPRENECHVRTRLTELVADPGEVEHVLETMNDLGDADRSERFSLILDQELTPRMAVTGTLRELRENRATFLARCLVGREALSLLAE